MTQPTPEILLALAQGYTMDLRRFMESRMLITGTSGSGQSSLVRLLLELAGGHVPFYIIDPEGEFASLRELFPDVMVCAPKDADAVATPATAPILARFFLETGVSAVLNIYDLKAAERLEFVQAFCEALVNAHQSLWRNAIIVIDEAHIFAPEGGKSACGQAVIDLATRGRKRGFCLCLATQRLAQLDKSAAGQMLNKFIGRTSMHLDVKRASEELGEPLKGLGARLRVMKPGQFYASGPALPDGVELFRAEQGVTTHAEAGKRNFSKPPEPGPKIRKLLADRLKDLPQQAIEEAVTMEQLRAQLEDSRETVRRLSNGAQAGVTEAEVQVRIKAAVEASDNEWRREYGLPVTEEEKDRHFEGIRNLIEKVDSGEYRLLLCSSDFAGAPPGPGLRAETGWKPVLQKFAYIPKVTAEIVRKVQDPAKRTDGISGPQQTILDVLAQFYAYGNRILNRTTLAVQAGASSKSSGFRNNLSVLKTAGLIQYPDGQTVALTDAGRGAAAQPARARTLAEFHGAWYGMISGPQGSILRHLIEIYPKTVSRPLLGPMVNASEKSSGFRNNLSVLKTMGAIEFQSGEVKASALMFPQGVKK